ncbi:MAG: hypothetical protein EP216_01955 [Epsilonproteobacteria bacterium]|nr:MAG: hypothetical protein EP216_01955 [Campylobacterota bacterium]
MDKSPSEVLCIDSLSEKETYTAEEKKFIMDRLNEQRLIEQAEAEKSFSDEKKTYTEEEKQKILDDLNEKRLSVQKREEIKKKRTYKKEIYKFGAKEYYKFTNMKRDYFIEIEDCKKITRRPRIVPLYYRSIDVLQKKDVLMKTEVYSEKFFISFDAIRVYFKGFDLENER